MRSTTRPARSEARVPRRGDPAELFAAGWDEAGALTCFHGPWAEQVIAEALELEVADAYDLGYLLRCLDEKGK